MAPFTEDVDESEPRIARVFESLGLDFCCGGDQSLRAACTENGLELGTVHERLAETREDQSGDHEWEAVPALVEHVVESHHEYLRKELSALADVVETRRSVHGDSHPELAAVEREFNDLADGIREHVTAEEDDVFPVIEALARGDDRTDEERAVLDDVLADLEALEADTHMHVREENDVLFQRVESQRADPV